MYRKVLESAILHTIGEYTITKSVEQVYFDNGIKCGKPVIWYEACLDGGDGDIVFSCNDLNMAVEWTESH